MTVDLAGYGAVRARTVQNLEFQLILFIFVVTLELRFAFGCNHVTRVSDDLTSWSYCRTVNAQFWAVECVYYCHYLLMIQYTTRFFWCFFTGFDFSTSRKSMTSSSSCVMSWLTPPPPFACCFVCFRNLNLRHSYIGFFLWCFHASISCCSQFTTLFWSTLAFF